jgi:hypothetical protein
MVLLKIIAKDLYMEQESISIKVDLISISEMDLKTATEIHAHIQSYEFFNFVKLDKAITLNSMIITDLSYITVIKDCFNFDTQYQNSDLNLTKLVVEDLKYREYDLITDILYYRLPYGELAQLFTAKLYEARIKDGFALFEHQLSDVIGLITLKRRMNKCRNFEIGITKIIGTYLDSERYKEYLQKFHRELY